MLSTLVFCCFTFIISLAQERDGKEAIINLGSTSNKLTAEFLYNGVNKFPGSNFVTSVYPLVNAAAQLYCFSEGKTKQKLLSITGLDNNEQIRKIIPSITRKHFKENSTASPIFTLKVYTDNDNEFCPAFKKSYKKTFGGDTGVVDYSEPDEAAKDINDYVKQQGRGAYKNLVSSKKIEDKNGYNFISTYDLQYKFDDRFVFTERKNLKFNSYGEIKNIAGAFGTGIVKYAKIESIDAQTIELLGEGGEYAYFIVYPNKPDGLMNVLDKFRDPEFFQSVVNQGEEVCAKAVVVDAEVTKTIDLGKSLGQMSYYKGLFVPGKPEFSGISQNCDDSYIASILHEVHLTPTPINGTSKGGSCTKYDVEIETTHPHVYYVMNAKRNTTVVRAAIVGIVVQS